MMGYKYAQNIEVDWLNKLKKNSASSWFLFHRYIVMHSEQNIKKKLLGTLTDWIAIISFNMHVHPSFWLHAVT